MNKFVSVVIPTYNYGRFIGEALESVLEQTLLPDEVIVVDDGSEDETEDAVKAFGGRVRYIRQENKGVCAARNNGAAAASGEFIAFLDADDIWEPEKLEKQIAKFAEDREIGLVHCGMREFDSLTGETLAVHLEGGEGWVADDLLLWEKPVVNVSGTVIVVTRGAFESAGGFDETMKVGEDWDLCYRIARKYKVGFVREALVNYRSHGVNAHKNVAEMERGMKRFYEKAFAAGDANVLKLKSRAYGNYHRVLSGSYFQSGDYRGFFKARRKKHLEPSGELQILRGLSFAAAVEQEHLGSPPYKGGVDAFRGRGGSLRHGPNANTSSNISTPGEPPRGLSRTPPW